MTERLAPDPTPAPERRRRRPRRPRDIADRGARTRRGATGNRLNRFRAINRTPDNALSARGDRITKRRVERARNRAPDNALKARADKAATETKIDTAVKIDTARKTEVATKLELARKETLDVMRLPVAPDLLERRQQLEKEGRNVLAVARVGTSNIPLPIPRGVRVESPDGSPPLFIAGEGPFNMMFVRSSAVSLTNNVYAGSVTLTAAAETSETEFTVTLNGRDYTVLLLPEPPDRVTGTSVLTAAPLSSAPGRLARLSPPNGKFMVDGVDVPPPNPAAGPPTVVTVGSTTITRSGDGTVQYTAPPGTVLGPHTLTIGTETRTLTITAGPESLEVSRDLLQRIHNMASNAANVLWMRHPELRTRANTIAKLAYEAEASLTGLNTADPPRYYATVGQIGTKMQTINKEFSVLLQELEKSSIDTVDGKQTPRKVMIEFSQEINKAVPTILIPAGATETVTVAPNATTFRQFTVPDSLAVPALGTGDQLRNITVGTSAPAEGPDAPLIVQAGRVQTLNGIPAGAKLKAQDPSGNPIEISRDRPGTYLIVQGRVVVKPGGVVELMVYEGTPPKLPMITIELGTLQRPVVTLPSVEPSTLPPLAVPTLPDTLPLVIAGNELGVRLPVSSRLALQLPNGTTFDPTLGFEFEYPDFIVSRRYYSELSVRIKPGVPPGPRTLQFRRQDGTLLTYTFNVVLTMPPVERAPVVTPPPTIITPPAAVESIPAIPINQIQEGKDRIGSLRRILQEAYNVNSALANAEMTKPLAERNNLFHDRAQECVRLDRALLALEPRMEAALKLEESSTRAKTFAALAKEYAELATSVESIAKATGVPIA